MTTLVANDTARDRLAHLRKAGKKYYAPPVKKPEPMKRTKKVVTGQPGSSLGQATPERVTHGGDLEIVGEAGNYRQRMVYPVERLAEHFHDWEYTALSTLRELYSVATTVNITSPYTGGRIDGGSGLGVLSERQRQAHNMVEYVFRRVGPNFAAVIRELVLDEPRVGSDKVRSLEEVAGGYTTWKDKARLRGVGVGLLKATSWAVERSLREVNKPR